MAGLTSTTVVAGGAATDAGHRVGTGLAAGANAGLRRLWVWILGFILGLVALVETYLLVQFWPASVGPGAIPPASADVLVFGQTLSAVPRETLFFIVVILGGSLGGSIHALRSLAWYVGVQRLSRSWVLRYCYLPIVGALLALVLYIIVRAGFLAGTSVDASSPFGFVALGALAGLFSDQGVTKLKTVFETLLAEAERGPDAAPQPKTAGG